MPGVKWGYTQIMHHNIGFAHGHSILSVCIQLNKACSYICMIVLCVFAFFFSVSIVNEGTKSLYMCPCEWLWYRWNKTQAYIQSGHPHHDCIRVSYNNQPILRNTLINSHQIGRGSGFCLWFLLLDDLFFLSFPEKGQCCFMSLLEIKMQGPCTISSWRTVFVMIGCHVSHHSPKVSHCWQWLDFWSKITFKAHFL